MNAPASSFEAIAAGLLGWARQALEAELRGKPAPAPPHDGSVGGLFFTLYDETGEVRGSRGTSAPEVSLAGLAPAMLRAAAFEDPRFPPLAAEELPRCRLAVTVLGAPVRIRGPEGIEPGVTALRVRAGLFSGTTLPEAAWGRGWDAATFLAVACRKAGLHALAWRREETEVLAFPSWRAAEPF